MSNAPIARTPLDHWHAGHSARFGVRDGWNVVDGYATVERELETARAGLGVADISAGTKISVRGRGVPSLAEFLVAAPASLKPRDVAAVSSISAWACRLSEEHLLLLDGSIRDGSTKRAEAILQCVANHRNENSESRTVRTDATSAYAGLWVIGPPMEALMSRLTHLDTGSIAFPTNTCAETTLAGVEALLVRTGELSVPSLRVYVAWDMGEYVWERIMEAGRDVNLKPLGMEALSKLFSMT